MLSHPQKQHVDNWDNMARSSRYVVRSQVLCIKSIKKTKHKPVSNKDTLAVHLIVSTTEILEFISQPKERESVDNQSFKEQYPFEEKGQLEYKK